ncbi:hypothetical protein CC78DRAFT_582460 [Lojkania enalia]|uniref:Uncharacterized protein n=1 Tax=Lojkania enalia TaxID=147567 RepID=A0A9P4K7P4_9PLEO|nr:hypothetical protein CC78DRAFT_582460 [Didymosphaeria enalia]
MRYHHHTTAARHLHRTYKKGSQVLFFLFPHGFHWLWPIHPASIAAAPRWNWIAQARIAAHSDLDGGFAFSFRQCLKMRLEVFSISILDSGAAKAWRRTWFWSSFLDATLLSAFFVIPYFFCQIGLFSCRGMQVHCCMLPICGRLIGQLLPLCGPNPNFAHLYTDARASRIGSRSSPKFKIAPSTRREDPAALPMTVESDMAKFQERPVGTIKHFATPLECGTIARTINIHSDLHKQGYLTTRLHLRSLGSFRSWMFLDCLAVLCLALCLSNLFPNKLSREDCFTHVGVDTIDALALPSGSRLISSQSVEYLANLDGEHHTSVPHVFC